MTITAGQGTAVRLSSSSSADEGRFPPGTLLAQRYRIAGRLGKGGMGDVYKATDLLLGQTVAMKFLPVALAADEGMLERFRNEVRLSRQVSHPNVCRVYDIGEVDGLLFLTMEFIDGEDLASLLRRIGHLPQAKGLQLARRLCAGLAAAHEKGVLHRDLKPANIMIDGRGQLLITDFGLAAFTGEVQGADIRSGTSAYMSPEQLSGHEVTPRSDVYALGLVLYEIFAGKTPFTASTVGELLELERGGAPPLSETVKDLDPAIDRAVARCLEADPRRRPSSALAAAAALPGADPLAAALSAGETPSPEMVAAAGEVEGMRPAWAIACLAVLAVALIVLTWAQGVTTILQAARLETPPQAMAQKARDVLANLGYTHKPYSTAYDYGYDFAVRDKLRHEGERQALAKVASARPPAVYFMYRSSSELVAPKTFGPRFVTEDDPPLTVPGMITLRLDHQGRLASLSAKPLDTQAPPAAFDWTKLFAASGLDQSKFKPADPVMVPLTAFDSQQAWVEIAGSEPLRVEAAAWRGKPVFVRMTRDPKPAGGGKSGRSSQEAANVIVTAILITAVCVLAWRNARLGRGDRRGAGRIALAMFVLTFATYLLQLPHALDAGEFNRVISAGGNALIGAALFGLIYLALEPHVRRRWPQSLISWTRLIGGGWRDPLVATHVLIGLAAGTLALALIAVSEWIAGNVTSAPTLNYANGTLRVLSAFLEAFSEAPMNAGWIFFLLFFAYRFFRNRWLALAVVTGLFIFLAVLGAPHPVYSAVLTVLHMGIMFAVLLRFGLLAGVAMRIPFFIEIPTTFDSGVWYYGAGWAAVLFVAALGVIAFRGGLGGQPVFRSEQAKL